MKTIANCNPIEFLQQTNKMRHAVMKYLKDTEIFEIRKRQPPEGVTVTEQAKKNLSDMLDVALENYPRETAEILGLACFIEPQDIENHTAAELLTPALELLNSKAVVDFFISLLKLEQTLTSV
jgi:hypothetical protein